jgi:hypothetical protein
MTERGITTSANNGVAGGSIAVGPPALIWRQPLPLASILFLLIGCHLQYWLPAPQVTGDSLDGIATNHIWVDISRSALALGTRSPCPSPA